MKKILLAMLLAATAAAVAQTTPAPSQTPPASQNPPAQTARLALVMAIALRE